MADKKFGSTIGRSDVAIHVLDCCFDLVCLATLLYYLVTRTS